MKQLLIIIFVFSAITARSQLSSLIWHSDTLFNLNPSTGELTQLNKWGSVSRTDTSSMLSPYIRKITSDALYQPIGNYLTTNESITLSGDISGSGTTAITATIGAAKVTNAMLSGSIDLATKVTGVLPFANGGISTAAATSATTGTMTVNMTSEVITITPTAACTFNASGGVVGQRATFVITTSGTSSFTLTWGTNFKTTATLATGTTTAKKFCVTFLYDGSNWLETNRTAAM